MKTWKSVGLGIGLFAMAVTTGSLVVTRPGERSVRPVRVADAAGPPKFSRADSTGVFVGVRTFRHDATLEVPYAVDDAVDLAYQFSLCRRVGLIPPGRVVLALSGKPQKEESQWKLEELREAGARVENASAGDILHLLKEQTARAGKNGIVVVSIASHGFLQNDDAYILGSTSTFRSPETAVRMNTICEIAGRASRSLIFVDACRDRVGQGSRGGSADPAPHIRRMGRIQGQVIFHAAASGKFAYDDPIAKNGAFTKAVLEGLSCEASAPRGAVLAETLHVHVERQVREWLERNDKPSAPPVTQVSMEGVTRNMPLAECWRCCAGPMRVEADGVTITAYDETRPLWRKQLGEQIVKTEVADLDADAMPEVVVGLRNRIVVLDRDGQPLWNSSAMPLRTFTTGDLFRKRTQQIVAIWGDERRSVLNVLRADGKELARFEQEGQLQHVAIGNATNMHHPKIITASATGVFVLKPKLQRVEWREPLSATIREIRIADTNGDSRREIVVVTDHGDRVFPFDPTSTAPPPSRRSAPAGRSSPGPAAGGCSGGLRR